MNIEMIDNNIELSEKFKNFKFTEKEYSYIFHKWAYFSRYYSSPTCNFESFYKILLKHTHSCISFFCGEHPEWIDEVFLFFSKPTFSDKSFLIDNKNEKIRGFVLKPLKFNKATIEDRDGYHDKTDSPLKMICDLIISEEHRKMIVFKMIKYNTTIKYMPMNFENDNYVTCKDLGTLFVKYIQNLNGVHYDKEYWRIVEYINDRCRGNHNLPDECR